MKKSIKQGEMLTSVTIRIEGYGNNKLLCSGTGFYYSIGQEENYIPFIITNKHVVAGCDAISILLTEADKDGNRLDSYLSYQIKDLQKFVVEHPDKNVDLCAISLYLIVDELTKEDKHLFTYYCNNAIIPSNDCLSDLDAIEDVIMVGYPNGIWDSINNLPIVRRGITATHVNKDYRGKREFMIDMACFPGSSGSPVFYLEKSYKTELSNGVMGHKVYLLGVLYSGHQHTAITTIQTEQTLLKLPTNIPNNLGIVIQASRILELEKIIIETVDKMQTA